MEIVVIGGTGLIGSKPVNTNQVPSPQPQPATIALNATSQT